MPNSREWIDKALQAVRNLAHARREFTADDLRASESYIGRPASSNHWGAVMKEAGERGICANTGMTKVSERKLAHGRRVAIWESLLSHG